jgi:hypothetical protein
MAFDTDAARKAGYTDAEIAAHLAKEASFDLAGAKSSGYTDGDVIVHLAGAVKRQAAIPGAEGEQARVEAARAVPGPSVGQRLMGAGETALTLGTGAIGGAVGMVGGTIKGMAEQLLSGQFGTPEAANAVEQAAAAGAQALTYAPRTESGQDQAAAVGGALQNLIPIAGVMPGMPTAAGVRSSAPASVMARAGVEGTARDVANMVARPAEVVGIVTPGAAGNAAAGAAGLAMAATGRAAASVKASATTLPRRAMEAIRRAPEEATPTPGTMGSMGAAGTDMAIQRRTLAGNLPVPIELTKGQASRNPAQLKFEVETAKNPEMGAPLRERLIQQNQSILQNMDVWIDQTGAQAPTLRATGAAVDAPLVKQAARDKAEVRVAYKKAELSPESGAMVDPASIVSIGEGDGALTSSPIAYLNQKPTGLSTTALTDHAKQYAVKLGIAEMQDGQLVGRPTTIKLMEDWRKEINQATGYEPTAIRDSTILKALIDHQTEPVAGPLYRQARRLRTRFSQNYEDHAIISKLLNEKRGTTDRQVAFEDVFKHSILDGSLDDVRTVRRVLQRGGPEGAQAWKELQGATMRDIRDKATGSVALDSANNRVISPAALDKAITALDADGKLDFIFGKKGAQQLRDIRELAQIARTVPPEAAINFSNTAATLLTGMADVAVSGISGVPAPLATVGRLGVRYIKDAKLRERINEALGEQATKAPGRSRFKAPPIDPTGETPPTTVH